MPVPTIFSYQVKDIEGIVASVDIRVAYDAATETIASLQGAAAAFGGALDAITDGQITEFTIKVPFLPDPSWKAAPVANSDVEETILYNFNQADTTYVEPIDVPAVKQSLLVGGKPTYAGAIKTFSDLIVAGSGAVFPCGKFSADLTGLHDLLKTFRKHRKAQSRRTIITP